MEPSTKRSGASPGATCTILRTPRIGITTQNKCNKSAQPEKRDAFSSHQSITLSAIDCLRFAKCCAPICPIDPDWKLRSHLPGERVCFYLSEYVKPGAEARFQGCTPRELYRAIQSTVAPISLRYAPIKKALDRAKSTGSRMRRPGRMADAA